MAAWKSFAGCWGEAQLIKCLSQQVKGLRNSSHPYKTCEKWTRQHRPVSIGEAEKEVLWKRGRLLYESLKEFHVQ